MRILATTLAALVMGTGAMAQQADSSYHLKGELKDLHEGTIYLHTYKADGAKKDSAIIKKDGDFEFTGFTAEPVRAVLVLKGAQQGDGNFLSFYLEPGKIKVEGQSTALKSLSIKGSTFNVVDAQLTSMYKPIDEWEEKNGPIYTEALKNKNKAVIDSLDAVDLQIMQARRKVVGDFIKANPNSLRSPMAIEQQFGYYAEASDVEPLYNMLTPAVQQSASGKRVKKMLDVYKTVAMGMTAPDIAQYDTTGKLVSLSSLRGNYVLVDFWASWCGPCRRENPNIVAAYAAYHPKGLEIFGVSYDNEKGKAKWIKAINDDKLFWTQVSDLKGWGNSTSEQYYVKAIPSNVLLDKQGRIIGKNLFGDKLKAKLAELMP